MVLAGLTVPGPDRGPGRADRAGPGRPDRCRDGLTVVLDGLTVVLDGLTVPAPSARTVAGTG